MGPIMAQRKRDYSKEYSNRIARGLRLGLTRSQSRGHPKPRETLAIQPTASPSYNHRLEAGFKAVEKGKTLTAGPVAQRRFLVEPEAPWRGDRLTRRRIFHPAP